MSSPVLPPLDGSLTLTPGFIDFHTKHNPDLPWVVFPSPDDPEKLGSVSFAELAKATHRIAHRVRPGRQGPDGEVVGLLIHCDALLYAAVIHGLARAGLVAFPISPRLSPPAIAGLLQAANARRIIIQSMLKPLLTAALSKITSPNYSPQVEDLWSIYDIFPTLKSGSTESVLEEGLYPERDAPFNLDEPVAVLHSSGSTGLPKAVFQTHRIVLQWASSNFCIEGRKRGLRWAAGGLPTLHAMGFIMQVIDPLGSGQAFALFTPTEPRPPIIPTADQVLNLARATNCSAIPTVPIFIETWAQSEESVKFLASLTTIGFAGGPLSSQTGIKLVKAGVSVQSMYGSTEGGVTSGCFDYDDSQGLDAPGKTSLDFEWMQFPPPVKTRFVEQGDGTYEMQYLTCETHQPAVENLPDTKGYATSDLFVPHPTKKGLWRVVGRVDDVIVLSTGEKIVPIPQESHISSSPLVAGAVMFGRGQTQPGVLIEPHPSHAINPANEAELIEYRNKVWPVIAEANALAPTFAKIYKETILVSDPAKPFPRAPKGTVIRKAALALYTDAVENLYKAVEQSAEATGINAPTSWEVQDIQAWLKEQAASLHDDISPDVSRDLFEQGFDSLSATFLRNRIISALRLLDKDAARNVSQNLVFDHPTIEQLAETVRALAASETAASRKPLVEHIKELVEKYSADLPQVQVTNPLSEQTLPEPVVTLTGSTGNIGSHILSAFLGFKRVQKVYVLDRTTSEGTPQERLTAAFKQRGLPVDSLSDARLVILGGDLNAEWFGLEKTAYEELKSSVSHIVHNAWKVDFNLGLGSFETQIAGTRKLIDFAASQSRPASLLFTSSISVAGKWDVSTGPVPETVLDNPEVATSSGYSASKYIVEKILAKAAQKGLTTTSLRIGQVTGSAQAGAWNTSDWVPIMVKSSLSLGALPSLPGSVSWISVDAVANIILDLVVLPQPEPPLVNVVHPRPIAWDTVFKLINDAIGANLPAVPYAEWLSQLEAHERDSSAQTLQRFPALKLLTFFRAFKSDVEGSSTEAGGHPVFSTTELLKQSGGALALPPLGPEHAQAWVRYWKDQAFLS